MTNKLVRRLLAGVLVLAAAGSIQAQTIEIYAGGATFRNSPAHEAPVIPTAVTIGPDGMVYVSDAAKGRLVRFDPVTNTATALPGVELEPPYYIGPPEFQFNADTLAMNPAGELFGGVWEGIFRINMEEGTRQFLTTYDWSSPATDVQMTFDVNGNLYYLKRSNAQYSSTTLFRRSHWGYTEYLIQGSQGNFGGDGGPLGWAGISDARGVALDAQGNLYLADTNNFRVRKITAIDGEITHESIITTVAGNGQWYSDDEGVPATSTGLNRPEALAVDAAGNLYIHERGANRVRRVSAADGTISTYVGRNWGYSGDGGPASEAGIDLINGNIVVDAASNLYLADMGSHRLRRVNAATGIIETVLGNGTMTFCTEVAPRRAACLGGPQGIEVDAGGNVYISDSRNLRIRRIDAATGELRTIAGTGFSYTHGGDGGPATAATFASDPGGISFDAAGNLLIAGAYANNVRRIDMATGIITTIAGTGASGFSGDGGPAIAARFSGIQDLVPDAAGNLYLSDAGNRRIRRISASGIVSTIAGNGVNGFSGDGGPATAAALQYPTDIKVDASGNVLFVDSTRLRRIDAATGFISTVAGTNSSSNSGDGGPATAAGIGWSAAIHIDAAGNIVLATGGGLRRIDATTGTINSITGPYGLSTPDGRNYHRASAMKFSPQGGLFISDPDFDMVFRIDGVPSGAADNSPPVINSVVNGDAGVEGWYRSNVAVSWSISDPESTVTSSNGCSATSVSQDTAGITFTCSATSSGGTATQSVTIRRDTVAPILTITDIYPTAPDSLGWYNTNIAISFWSDDALSGVYSESSEFPLIIRTEGTGVTGQLVVTDRAGNTTTYTSPAYNLDLYPPSIGYGRPFPTGNNDWYTTNVHVDLDVDDPISPIRTKEGCDDFDLTTDTPGTTFTCTVTSAGGTQTFSFSLKRDATPPTLVFGPPSPAPNASGWHNSDVSFPFTTSDGTSGVASTSSSGPVVITGEGTGLTATVTVTDAAGNSAIFTTPPVNIDRTVPLTVTPVIAGTLGNEGWYTSDVQVSWNITGNVLTSTGCGTSNVIADTAAVTFTCSVTGTNGTASNSVTLKRDATPPVLTWRPATPNANAAGWNRTNVNFPYNAPTDLLAGVASVSSLSPLVVSAEGAGVTGSVTVTDRAGNAAVFTTTPRNIDKTAPTVTVRTPLHNKVYGLYSTLIADFDCTDAVSGTTSCSGTAANGATLNTRSMNSNFTFRVTSADVAGNSVTKSNAWSVAGSFLFEGYLAPMGNDPIYNLVTAGTRVPMRFRLPDRNGGYVSDMTAFQSFNVATERCISSSTPLNDVATGGPGLSFDSATSTFTYHWDTNASWAGTCRNANIRLIDGSRHTLYFKFQ